ncbi:MAG: adaptor protein MecA [Lachnospiraceae bacterium]|nr:adaptor protein MecA [Lachnospiraceae bacterium]
MKIEKINDNQIRCTLTKEDLELRHIKLSELAYGTEKAKSLFREMLKWASYKYGFEAEDIPLMIEAVPLSDDSIVLIVTKIEYPEELDTRFSRFTEDTESDDQELDDFMDYDYDEEDVEYQHIEPVKPSSASDIIDLFKKAKEVSDALSNDSKSKAEVEIPIDITKLFVFNSLDDVIELSSVLGNFYHGENALYKNKHNKKYYLVISKSDHTPEEFNKVCNIISEYGQQENLSLGSDAYFTEHYSSVILKNALSTLQQL